MVKFNTSELMEKERNKYKIKCKNCGHTLVFFPFEKKDKKICSWCQHTVYANDKVEFKDKLKKIMG